MYVNLLSKHLSCNLILLLNIWIWTNFQILRPSDLSVLAIFTKLFFFFWALHCVLFCLNLSQVRQFLSAYGQSLCNWPQSKHGLEDKYFLFFLLLFCLFLWRTFYIRYTAFLDVFRVLANTIKTLAVFNDLMQRWIRLIFEFIENVYSDFYVFTRY